MTSKKVLKGKDARLPRRNEVTREFRKDWLALQRAGINLAALKEAMTLLIANEGPPGPEWSDHPLKGRWDGFRECHAGGDLLLIYRVNEESVVFTRAGTHSELFE
jgi:mRNA interferase YafQ